MNTIYSPNIIGNESMVGKNTSIIYNLKSTSRNTGPIVEYKFISVRPNKKLKEIKRVLLPERKKFMFKKLGCRFNIKDRCVVCGAHHMWDSGDALRPPIPLTHVSKGRPMRGTYCPKHASMFKQFEMLEQQIIADKHGLEFKKYIPRAKVPQIIKRGPLVALTEQDIISLTGKGWDITPPSADTMEAGEKLMLLLLELKGKIAQIDEITGVE
tara:strand:+ start:1263 stop:1898 length:636 start_codon:yes stop_codon:yes gene_type:complete